MEWQAGPASVNGGRSYWIQGRQGTVWSNLETADDVQAAIDRLGRLVASDRYDELRLVEARLSATDGRASYAELLIVRDGEVVDPSRADPVAPSLPRTDPVHPELPLWRDGEAPGDQPALFDAVAATPEPEERDWIVQPPRRRLSLSVEPRDEPAVPEAAPAPRRRRPVLLGLFVLALLIGGGLSALDPTLSARLSASLFGQLPGLEPRDPLSTAIRADDPARVAAALARGVDSNQPLPDGTLPLLAAARVEAEAAMLALMEGGADPTMPVAPGRGLLHAMAAEGLVLGLGAALDAGAPVDLAGGAVGCVTPLMAAAAQGQTRAAVLLAERGAALVARPGCAVGPMQVAALYPELQARLSAIEAARAGEPAGVAERARPFSPAERRGMLMQPERLGGFLAQAIDRDDLDTLRFLMANRPVETGLDDLGLFASDRWGTGYRAPVDYAVLADRLAAAEILMGAGAVPTPGLIHRALEARGQGALPGALERLLDLGADPNARHDGLTALMRAAVLGDWDAAQLLMTYGGDPALRSAEGRRAADFARDAGDEALWELLSLRADGDAYATLMLGFDWFDTPASLGLDMRTCRAVADGFRACALDAPTWLGDAASLEALFDGRAGDRLVALEIRGEALATEAQARARFDAVAEEIDALMPAGRAGFTVATPPNDPAMPFAHALRPEVGQAAWYRYWSDDDKRHPVFVHLSLIGLGEAGTAYRVLIGNPFRAG